MNAIPIQLSNIKYYHPIFLRLCLLLVKYFYSVNKLLLVTEIVIVKVPERPMK